MSFDNIQDWIKKYPLLKPVTEKKPLLWLNSSQKAMKDIVSLPLNKGDMEQAARFMELYAPYLAKIFPSTAPEGGHIHSPLREIPTFKEFLNKENTTKIEGRLFLKCDNELAVAGSIKARGGFFEVLSFAHKLAGKEGLLNENEAVDFSLPHYRDLFSRYTIGVGSTGNLGLSIGIISAQLGFKVNVFMSSDAKNWKKELLREKGATVVEVPGDFGIAIAKGRRQTLSDPHGYFVDDENSSQLFLGYSLAAFELHRQLQEQQITIDKEHPLFIYSPCGVGGSPGGVAFGLKNVYSDDVFSFFAEPTHSPAVLTGLITGKKEKVSVHDFGIDNITAADGLAVGRPSAFASGIIKKLVSGIYTIEDAELFTLLKKIYRLEDIFLEPSATAGLAGPQRVLATNFVKERGIDPSKIVHVAWATGGSLVPESLREEMLGQ